MGIHRGILHHDIFRHTDTERGKVPYSFDATRYHGIRNALGYLDRYSQHTDVHIIFAHLLLEFTGMEDRYSVQCSAYQFRGHIKCCYNFQPEVLQTGVAATMPPPRLPTPNRNALCISVNPRKSSSTAISVSTS